MITVWLTLVLCTGAVCESMELPVEGPYACAMAGQAIAAEWIKLHHPGAELRRWRCEMGRPA